MIWSFSAAHFNVHLQELDQRIHEFRAKSPLMWVISVAALTRRMISFPLEGSVQNSTSLFTIRAQRWSSQISLESSLGNHCVTQLALRRVFWPRSKFSIPAPKLPLSDPFLRDPVKHLLMAGLFNAHVYWHRHTKARRETSMYYKAPTPARTRETILNHAPHALGRKHRPEGPTASGQGATADWRSPSSVFS
jgi:hypothetical protein